MLKNKKLQKISYKCYIEVVILYKSSSLEILNRYKKNVCRGFDKLKREISIIQTN